MKLTIKSLALAVALAASATGASAATINNGANGNGGLFFNIWDGASSYTLNLGLTIDSFTTKLAETGNIDLSFTDTLLNTYLSTANMSKIKWNVLATDTKGANRVLETYSTMPATTTTNGNVRSIASQIQTALTTGGTAVNSKLGTVDSAIFASSEVGYFGKSTLGTNFGGVLQNFSNAGTLANNSFATGLNFMIVDALATGLAKSTYSQYLDGANKVSVYFDAANTLHIAAVPEPESYAMLLAGLGLLGFMARRNKRA